MVYKIKYSVLGEGREKFFFLSRDTGTQILPVKLADCRFRTEIFGPSHRHAGKCSFCSTTPFQQHESNIPDIAKGRGSLLHSFKHFCCYRTAIYLPTFLILLFWMQPIFIYTVFFQISQSPNPSLTHTILQICTSKRLEGGRQQEVDR